MIAKESIPEVVSWPAMRKIDHLCNDEFVPHYVSCPRILAIDHGVQHIILVHRIGSPVCDDTFACACHHLASLRHLCAGSEHEALDERGFAHACSVLLEDEVHCLHERMHGVRVERVEPVAHGAECDSVKREPGEIFRDKDSILRSFSRPRKDQLVSNVSHVGEHVRPGQRRERRHENSMALSPIWIFIGGSE